jgi:pyruvate ferredoxin oxidoreductase beta subunit
LKTLRPGLLDSRVHRSRTFPVFIYDPRKGERFRDRLSLVGNPNVKADWYIHPKTKEEINFCYFAKTEGRFSKHFDKDGKPSDELMLAQKDRLDNWRLLQDLAGISQ